MSNDKWTYVYCDDAYALYKNGVKVWEYDHSPSVEEFFNMVGISLKTIEPDPDWMAERRYRYPKKLEDVKEEG